VSDKQVDILIIGGGLIGASLLLALNSLGFKTLLIEAQPFTDKVKADLDARSLALSPASIRILKMLSIWPELSKYATAIENIHVSDQYRFGATRLKGDENNPLGFVAEMQHINRVLHQMLPENKILAPAKLVDLDKEQASATVSHLSDTISIQAKLIVAADGTNSPTRAFCGLTAQKNDFKQTALVCNIQLKDPHCNRAFERFTPDGPLALLPMTDNRMSLVWTMPPEKAKTILDYGDPSFLKTLYSVIGYRVGRIERVGRRYSFPLIQSIMPEQAQWPVVFVGNAAHTLHPVAGQGFNLGLRDIAMLAQLISEKGINHEMLNHYLEARRLDQSTILQLTNGLIRIFSHTFPGIKFARNLGMIAMDNIPSLKKLLAYYARGYGGITPDLVCEIPLKSGKRSTHDAII